MYQVLLTTFNSIEIYCVRKKLNKNNKKSFFLSESKERY